MAIVSPSISIIRLVDCGWRADGTQLAACAHGNGGDSGRDLHQLHIREAHPADLPRRSARTSEVINGRVGETFFGIRVVRAFRRGVAGAARVHARPAHRVPQGAVRATTRAGDLDVVGAPRAGVNVIIVWYGG